MHSHEEREIISGSITEVYHKELLKLQGKFDNLNMKFEILKHMLSASVEQDKINYVLETQRMIKENAALKVEINNGESQEIQKIIEKLKEDLATSLYVFNLAWFQHKHRDLNSENPDQNLIHQSFWGNYNEQEKLGKDSQLGMENSSN